MSTIKELREAAEAAAQERYRREVLLTPHQLRAIKGLCKQLGLSESEALEGTAYDEFAQLSRRAASGTISRLTAIATGVDVAGVVTGSSFSVINGKVEHREAPPVEKLEGFML